MKKLLFLFFLLLLIMNNNFAITKPMQGNLAPNFIVKDADGNTLSLSMLKGKKIVVGFYGSKGTRNMNRPLINYMQKVYYKNYTITKNSVFRLSVVDASSANIFTRWIWKYKMRSISKEEGVTIYGDWSGNMRKSYGFPEENGSTFLIIDRNSIIKYRRTGVIPKSEFKKIKKIILSLI